MSDRNVDDQVVSDFGREWQAFDQSPVPDAELRRQFERYFAVFPWDALPPTAVGFDAGCGSGRWARFVAPRVGHLHCVDASAQALAVARRTLAQYPNCTFSVATVNDLPFPDETMDFGYSLGVLHHVPDTFSALAACVTKLKQGAPLLLYLYYALDGRPWWFRGVFRAVDAARKRISHRPHRQKTAIATVIALCVYVPLARAARLAERLGREVDGWPLSFYRDRSVYTMRTDALDRFGTRLEQRFTKDDIVEMLTRAGLRDVVVSPEAPYWCAVGVRGRALT
jgi:SAM-dependent methyltransferase